MILENKSPKYTSQEALDSLLKHARKPISWPAALRTLMVFHKLTHMHGNVLSDFLVSNQLDNLAQFKSTNTPLSKEALGINAKGDFFSLKIISDGTSLL